MKQMMRIMGLIGCGFLAPMTWAHSVEEGLIQAFTQCDDSVFDYLRQHQNALQAYAPIKRYGQVARFQDKGRYENAHVRFQKPLTVNGIDYIEFANTVLNVPARDADKSLKLYFWSLKTAQKTPIMAIMKTFPQLDWQKQGDVMATNARIIPDVSRSLSWQANPSATSHTIPANHTAEKVLFLEKADNDSWALTCTLQGNITPALLKRIRPDLEE